MSFQHTLDGLLNKGKAKLREFTNPQDHPTGGPQYNGPPYPSYNTSPAGSYYQAPPPPNSSYNIPPAGFNHQASPPYYGSPPPAHQNNLPPPIPTSTRPSFTGSNANTSTTYWQPDFNPATPISTHFIQETGAHGWGNNESQNYTTSPANCFFTPNRQLVLRAIASSSSPEKYTSARLISHQKLSRQRGCLTAVLTAPCAQGIWPAFWMLPAQPFTWPNDGEIDIFESWNGDRVNHSCLHWGHFNGEDWDKHRVVETPIPGMGTEKHRFDLAWEQPENGDGGRLVWYIDGRAVMKAGIPRGTRRMSDWTVILNVAMGGNVCQGKLPADGVYDFVVHELSMSSDPVGGWGQFESDWERTREGHPS